MKDVCARLLNESGADHAYLDRLIEHLIRDRKPIIVTLDLLERVAQHRRGLDEHYAGTFTVLGGPGVTSPPRGSTSRTLPSVSAC